MELSLVSLVPLKEGSMQARELADRNSLQQLQAMYDQLMRDMEQEAEPEGGPIADQYADQMQDIEDAMQIKRGGSGEMTYGDMLHKNYPDKYGPGGVALDKDTFTKSSKFDRMNEAKIKTKEEFNSNASAEQKAMEKKWDSLVTDIALSKSDNKQFRTNMEAKQEYLEKLNDEGKLKKKYSADKIEGWSTSSSFPGWKVASTVLANKTDENLSEMKSMSADDRTKNMLRTIIHQEVTKLNEADVSQKVKNLTFGIQKSIVSLDPNMPYRVFAKSVAQVLIDDYGTHNYEPFIRELKNALDSTLGDDEVEG